MPTRNLHWRMPRATDQAAKFASPKLIKRSFGLDSILRTKILMDGFQIGVTSSVFLQRRELQSSHLLRLPACRSSSFQISMRPKAIFQTCSLAIPVAQNLATPSFKCEHARSGRSSCKLCGDYIEDGAVRVGPMVENEYGHKIEWHHVECFVATKKGSGIKASANNSLMAEARRSWTLHWKQWCHRPPAMIRARPTRAEKKAAARRNEGQ
jgi:hypothetical protein